MTKERFPQIVMDIKFSEIRITRIKIVTREEGVDPLRGYEDLIRDGGKTDEED